MAWKLQRVTLILPARESIQPTLGRLSQTCSAPRRCISWPPFTSPNYVSGEMTPHPFWLTRYELDLNTQLSFPTQIFPLVGLSSRGSAPFVQEVSRCNITVVGKNIYSPWRFFSLFCVVALKLVVNNCDVERKLFPERNMVEVATCYGDVLFLFFCLFCLFAIWVDWNINRTEYWKKTG